MQFILLDGRRLQCMANLNLAAEIRFHDELREIDLSGMSGSLVYSKKIIDAMMTNPFLEKIDMSRNILQDEGAIKIAELLKMNMKINSLWLNRCDIGNTGAKAIAENAMYHPTLQSIGIAANAMTYDGIKPFADLLKANNVLRYLCIWMGPDSIEMMIDALKVNTTLRELVFQAGMIPYDQNKNLKEMLAMNHSLTSFTHNEDILQLNRYPDYNGTLSTLLLCLIETDYCHYVFNEIVEATFMFQKRALLSSLKYDGNET